MSEIASIECKGPNGAEFIETEPATVQPSARPGMNYVTCRQAFSASDQDYDVYCFKGSQLLGDLDKTLTFKQVDRKYSAEALKKLQCIKCIRALTR